MMEAKVKNPVAVIDRYIRILLWVRALGSEQWNRNHYLLFRVVIFTFDSSNNNNNST